MLDDEIPKRARWTVPILWLAALGIGANCGTCMAPGPVASPPVFDAGVGTCGTACARRKQLGCYPFSVNPSGVVNGVDCITVCANVQGAVKWDLTCRTNAATCAAADACEP